MKTAIQALWRRPCSVQGTLYPADRILNQRERGLDLDVAEARALTDVLESRFGEMKEVARKIEVEPMFLGHARLKAAEVGNFKQDLTARPQEGVRRGEGGDGRAQVLQHMPEDDEVVAAVEVGVVNGVSHHELNPSIEPSARLAASLQRHHLNAKRSERGRKNAATSADVEDASAGAELVGDAASLALSGEPGGPLDGRDELRAVVAVGVGVGTAEGGVVGLWAQKGAAALWAQPKIDDDTGLDDVGIAQRA